MEMTFGEMKVQQILAPRIAVRQVVRRGCASLHPVTKDKILAGLKIK